MKRFALIFVTVIALAEGALIAYGFLPKGPQAQNISKGGCVAAGGQVIESGIDGWWFCCKTESCWSCNGEVHGELELNCALDSSIQPPTGGDPSSPTVMLRLPTKRAVVVPPGIWKGLDSATKRKLATDPDALGSLRAH